MCVYVCVCGWWVGVCVRPVARGGLRGSIESTFVGERGVGEIIIIFLSASTHAHTTKSQSVSQGPPAFSFEVHQIIWSSA